MDFKTIEELLNYTETIKGKKFKEFDKNNVLNVTQLSDKGIIGKLVETEFYKYPNNSDAKADFDELGVELKVTALKQNKNKSFSAKERLVLSKIDFCKIVEEEFEFSKLLFKNKKLLIIWYKHEKGKFYSDMEIVDYQMYDMSIDEDIIKNDFNIIKSKVMEGKAEEISEGQTSYLGACTKSKDSSSRTKQPYSAVPAPPRAFSLKNSYMTGILRNLVENNLINTSIVMYKTIEEFVLSKIEKYIGKSQIEILNEITGKPYTDKIPKNIGKMISDKLIGKDKELKDKDELFKKTTYIIKSLPVDNDGIPIERMSFRQLVISEFTDEWNESDWKTYFEEVTIIVVCYKASNSKERNGYRVLDSVKKISFNYDDIEMFSKSYNMVKEAIDKKDISLLPYPKSFEGQIMEIAPKGIKGDDAYNNFFNKDVTKTCFMFSKEFLIKKLNIKGN
ncbi:MAG: Sau3AI family type II restriction endonuclease [Clostridia bacterium]